MKLKIRIVFSAILVILVLGACGKEKENKPAATEEKVEQTDNKKEDEKAANEEKEEENADTDSENLNPYLAEETGGDVEIIFTNKTPNLKHSYSDKVTVEINEYQIVHVTNMNESAKVDFNDEDEGYVLTYKLTLDNQSDEDVYYAGGSSLLSDDGMDHIMKKSHFVDRDKWLKDKETDDVSQYSKEKSFSGLVAYAMTKEQFEKLETPTLKIDALWLNNNVSDRLGTEAVFVLPFNEEGVKKAEATAGLYADKMLTDTIADKELFFAKEDINETKEIDKVKVTLNGVQYTNVTPTAANKERFTNFGDGPLVALTAKLTVENGSDVAIEKFLMDKRLIIDDTRGTMLSQGMLEPTARGTLDPGKTEEVLAVFLFREDEFQIYKKLDLQFGPLSDSNMKKLFKEKSVTFTLPMKE
ncbi:DUF5068 domain-containing protein [Cytobacillus dafuensis]|uniref:DUF5068 domain-containing protein n=1 Tax=Cytobacillus dafuensis TaxID=1742359 RepID=A0A5B8YZP0_CYTDA|nr:DUF5068 domain-containing protein [Cytobacillus dafuensis]QED46145.1 DUF5068 domain-containing protein [Cytobacillus dafuensis]